jgi:phosphatidylserine/phosphatidylglycerophosphate/cardiolipin synthase-like enzyme
MPLSKSSDFSSVLIESNLYDEKSFYAAFINDLDACREEVIIESPFITSDRMKTFDGIFKKLVGRGVTIYIITRDPKEHTEGMEIQSEEAIRWCEAVGIQVLLCLGNHHRKLAILDRKALWEGSLNILSQTYSREIMRRIGNQQLALEMFNFLKLGRFI